MLFKSHVGVDGRRLLQLAVMQLVLSLLGTLVSSTVATRRSLSSEDLELIEAELDSLIDDIVAGIIIINTNYET